MCWFGGVGWNICFFYEYVMLIGNEVFFKKYVFLLYREMVDFYEDYLIMDGDSLYYICFSVFFENVFLGIDIWLSKDVIMDVVIVKEVFCLFFEMGCIFCVDKKELVKWNNYL